MFRHPDFSPLSDYPQKVRLLKSQYIQALADFDIPMFGAHRAGLFHELLTEFPERGFAVYDASGEMAGYLFAQTQWLGPMDSPLAAGCGSPPQAALTLTYKGGPLAIAHKQKRRLRPALALCLSPCVHKPPHAAGPVGHTRTAHRYLWADKFCDRIEPNLDKPKRIATKVQRHKQ